MFLGNWGLPNFWNSSGNDGSQGGYAFGWSSPASASGQASSIDLETLLNTMNEYSSQQTNAQREIQQDFFNQQKEFNANQANIEREWQEKMSNSAYQRMVQDLEKAGLNKLLAYNNNPTGVASVGGASAGMPNVARGSDATSALSSLATNNANKQGGIYGIILQLVGGLVGGIGSIVDSFTRSKK